MRLVNVRLNDADLQRVQALRDQGVELSQLVRNAIRTAYESHQQPLAPRDVRRMIEKIHADIPTPPSRPRRNFDLHDRTAFANAFASHVRGRNSR